MKRVQAEIQQEQPSAELFKIRGEAQNLYNARAPRIYGLLEQLDKGISILTIKTEKTEAKKILKELVNRYRDVLNKLKNDI